MQIFLCGNLKNDKATRPYFKVPVLPHLHISMDNTRFYIWLQFQNEPVTQGCRPVPMSRVCAETVMSSICIRSLYKHLWKAYLTVQMTETETAIVHVL